MTTVARIFSAQPSLMSADIITIETDLSRGLFSFAIVGLPGKAVEEARDRVSSAASRSFWSLGRAGGRWAAGMKMLASGLTKTIER